MGGGGRCQFSWRPLSGAARPASVDVVDTCRGGRDLSFEDPKWHLLSDDGARDEKLGEAPLGSELPLVEVAELVEGGRLTRSLVLAHPGNAGKAQGEP